MQQQNEQEQEYMQMQDQINQDTNDKKRHREKTAQEYIFENKDKIPTEVYNVLMNKYYKSPFDNLTSCRGYIHLLMLEIDEMRYRQDILYKKLDNMRLMIKEEQESLENKSATEDAVEEDYNYDYDYDYEDEMRNEDERCSFYDNHKLNNDGQWERSEKP